MKIERVDEMRLSPVDEAEIAALLARSFETDFGGRSYFMQRHHVRFIMRDGPVIGHMALGLRSIRMGADLVPVAGLADVATDPDHRGRGIASALLEAAIEEAVQSPAEFFLLFGDAPLYAGHGFASATNRLRYVDMTNAYTGDTFEAQDKSLMVLPLSDRQWDATAPIDLIGHKF